MGKEVLAGSGRRTRSAERGMTVCVQGLERWLQRDAAKNRKDTCGDLTGHRGKVVGFCSKCEEEDVGGI